MITLTNNKRRGKRWNEPINMRREYIQPALSAGKRSRVLEIGYISVLISSLANDVTQVFLNPITEGIAFEREK